jgi:hypothetical protein
MDGSIIQSLGSAGPLNLMMRAYEELAEAAR